MKTSDSKETRLVQDKRVILSLSGISKQFPGVLANDGINFDLKEGEIHTILGENGAGKSTLMNIIDGIFPPDSGKISLFGHQVVFSNPRQAISHGIGMVFQHFMLIQNHSVAENIILGTGGLGQLKIDQVHRQINEICERYDLHVDPERKIRELSIGEQQRVEIIKVLYRGAKILILDEPTAVLTPQESEALYQIMQRLAEKNHSIIFISHKMKEVLDLSHRITVLNRGRSMGTFPREETNGEMLSNLMLGKNDPHLTSGSGTTESGGSIPEGDFKTGRISSAKKGEEVVRLTDIYARNDRGNMVLNGLSFSLHQGEIVGVAGVSGNGQVELAEVLSGMRNFTRGSFTFLNEHLRKPNVVQMIKKGVGYIPEDRKSFGVSSGLSIAYNFMLRDLNNRKYFKHGMLQRNSVQEWGRNQMKKFDVRAPSEKINVGSLSGGNMQKVILARETSRQLRLLLACQSTRGLDIHATSFIRTQISKARERGLAVLWISEDLDELMMLADRIAVIFRGKFIRILKREEASMQLLGRLMTGVND